MISKLIDLLLVLTILSLSTGCSSKTHNTSPDSTLSAEINQSTPTSEVTNLSNTAKNVAPVAIVSIEGQTLTFECVDRVNCLSNINLEGHILLDSPFKLGPVFYWNPSSVYLILYSDKSVPMGRNVIHINPQTGEIKSTKLSSELNNLHFVSVDDRLIFAEDNGQNIYIISNDLSIRNLEVDSSINSLIETKDQRVIALDERPLEIDGVVQVNVSIIDVVTGQTTKEHLRLPELELRHAQTNLGVGKKYLINIEGISRDLKNLYCLYFLGSEPQTPRLGAFNIENSREVASTSNPELVRITSGYAQYHEMLYTSNSGDGYGVGASLIEMSTVTSLLDFTKNPDWKRKLDILPFGDYFLLGTANNILLLSSTGEELKNYPLPKKWINQQYRMMYFMQ
jgi:hypothetical protein